jgi:hypothetical protein
MLPWEGVCIGRDSMMVVWAITKKAQTENNAFNCIISCIFSLFVEFDNVRIYHIKRELNSHAGYWAKLGMSMDEGMIEISGTKGVPPIL